MNFTVFLQQFGNGILLGGLFALLSIGYTLVYGVLRLINFAHCDIFMIAMYIAFYCVSVFHLPWFVTVIIVIVATAFLGMLTERLAYRPLRTKGAPKISLLISAIGVSYLLENLGVLLFTGRPKVYPSMPYLTEVITLGSVRLQRLILFVPIITLILLAALLLLINKTKTGMSMRALAKDLETAKLMGININTTIMFTFAVGSSLAAVGAILWGLKYPQITPTIGMTPGLKCFIAAVVGGIGNVKGAVVGGFLLGMLEIMLVAFFPALSSYRDAFAFIVLIIILMVKPTGLVGEKIADKA